MALLGLGCPPLNKAILGSLPRKSYDHLHPEAHDDQVGPLPLYEANNEQFSVASTVQKISEIPTSQLEIKNPLEWGGNTSSRNIKEVHLTYFKLKRNFLFSETQSHLGSLWFCIACRYYDTSLMGSLQIIRVNKNQTNKKRPQK